MRLPSLAGFTVGVTADRRREEQAQLLERHGARVVHGPSIRTIPLLPDEGLLAATLALVERPPDVVVLTTGLGTRGWFAAAEGAGCGDGLLAALRPARLVARGPKAAGAALTAGLVVEWRAPGERSDEVVRHLADSDIAGARVAVQLDGRAQPVVGDALRALGADVVDVPVYRWTLPEDAEPARRLIEAACDRRLDAVTFTAAPAVWNLFELAEAAGRGGELRDAFAEDVLAMCVGPVCAEAAVDLGAGRVAQPRRARLGPMVQTLAERFAGREILFRLQGVEVVVQGALLVVDGTEVALSDRERGVLAVLAERPGVVVSKATLLRRVWGSGQADEHVVEVSVARLRERLGRAGPGLRTEVRRGYRLAVEGAATSTRPSATRTA